MNVDIYCLVCRYFNELGIIVSVFKHEQQQVLLLFNIQLGRCQPSGSSSSHSLLHSTIEWQRRYLWVNTEPFCHYTHKNLGTKQAPFRKQKFRIYLDDLINVKYVCIDNYTHGSEMTISIADHEKYTFLNKVEPSPKSTKTSIFVREKRWRMRKKWST